MKLQAPIVLMAICGAAVSMATALQPSQNTVQPNTPDSTRSAPSTVRSDASNQDVARVLDKIDGVWNVEMRVDPAFWNAMMMMDSKRIGDSGWKAPETRAPETNTPGKPSDMSTSQDSNSKNQPGSATPRTGAGDQPRVGDNPSQPTGTNTAQSQGLTHTLRGVAEVKQILDGNAIQERVRLTSSEQIPPSQNASTPRTPGVVDDSTGSFQAVSLISFEPNSDKYNAAFLCDKNGEMKFEKGQFTASTDRIEFRCDPAHKKGAHDWKSDQHVANRPADPSGRANRDTPAERRDPNNPDSNMGNPDRTTDRERDFDSGQRLAYQPDQPMRVVLEVLNNNSYRVSMYALDSTAGTNWNKPDATRPDATRPISGEGRLISQATYSRVAQAQADSLRSSLDR